MPLRLLALKFSSPYRFRFRGAPRQEVLAPVVSHTLEIPRSFAGLSWEGNALEPGRIIPAWTAIAFATGDFGRAPLALSVDSRVLENFSGSKAALLQIVGECKPAPDSLSPRDVWLHHFASMRLRDPVLGSMVPSCVVPDRLFVNLFNPEPFSPPEADTTPEAVLPAISAWHEAMDKLVPVTLIVTRTQAAAWKSAPGVGFELDVLATDEVYPAHHPGLALARGLYPYGFGQLRYAWTELRTLTLFEAALKRSPEAGTMPLLLAGCRPDGVTRVMPWTRIDRGARGAPDGSLLVQGGLLTGTAGGAEPVVRPWDRAWTFLTADDRREFLWFMNPGFTRDSSSPLFASRYLPQVRRELGAGLRGERRFCIACNRCETHCPANLDPQYLWKCLRKGFVEEAQAHGLSRCLECGLCSYACPSKIELVHDFRLAREKAARAGKGAGR